MATAAPIVEPAKPNSHTTLQSAKRNINFLLDPKNSSKPTKLTTRTLLRTARYIAVFVFWRLVRYAKYAAVGAIGAAVAGTAIGSVASGAAFILAPPGIVAGAGVGLMWAVAKFGWRTMGRRVKKGDVEGVSARQDEELEHVPEPAIKAARVEPW